MKQSGGFRTALVSVIGRLLLAFLLWVAVFAFAQVSPYAQAAPALLSVVVNIGKVALPIFVLWPLLALVYPSRRSVPNDAVGPVRGDD